MTDRSSRHARLDDLADKLGALSSNGSAGPVEPVSRTPASEEPASPVRGDAGDAGADTRTKNWTTLYKFLLRRAPEPSPVHMTRADLAHDTMVILLDAGLDPATLDFRSAAGLLDAFAAGLETAPWNHNGKRRAPDTVQATDRDLADILRRRAADSAILDDDVDVTEVEYRVHVYMTGVLAPAMLVEACVRTRCLLALRWRIASLKDLARRVDETRQTMLAAMVVQSGRLSDFDRLDYPGLDLTRFDGRLIRRAGASLNRWIRDRK